MNILLVRRLPRLACRGTEGRAKGMEANNISQLIVILILKGFASIRASKEFPLRGTRIFRPHSSGNASSLLVIMPD